MWTAECLLVPNSLLLSVLASKQGALLRTVRSILPSERRLWYTRCGIRTVRKLQARVGPVKGQSTTHAAHRPSATAAVDWQTRDHLFILLTQEHEETQRTRAMCVLDSTANKIPYIHCARPFESEKPDSWFATRLEINLSISKQARTRTTN